MPVIPAIQEAEIRRIANSSRDPILKKTHHKRRDKGVGQKFKPQY
jgi:hypothetical protein